MKEYKLDDIIEVIVTGVEDYGIFVKAENDYNGLIHISEISDGFVKNIYTCYKINEHIEAKIINIDEEKKQLKLSVKNLEIKPNKREKIVEVGDGFNILKEHLDTWIDDKIKELDNE